MKHGSLVYYLSMRPNEDEWELYAASYTFVSKIKMAGCVQAGVASEMYESKNELGGIAEAGTIDGGNITQAAINNHSSNGILT